MAVGHLGDSEALCDLRDACKGGSMSTDESAGLVRQILERAGSGMAPLATTEASREVEEATQVTGFIVLVGLSLQSLCVIDPKSVSPGGIAKCEFVENILVEMESE
jgi:hypothetical protein